ncbi:MAG: FKBP-type peptidyl-prolyl cis-trans isomerase [Burkholderiales bacterium]|jgi:FKBP-type peptidyl-prolyl cis-trans isomerase SlpA|nr:FKBP-type peptidyl-prolyl cis-trans isomerase [Burkholderiales bacterium]
MSDATRIAPDSFVTLRYRLALADGTEVVSTFGGNPATFQLGAGQLAPPLEERLVGLSAGQRERFDLPADALGAHRPELVQRARRADLPAGTPLVVGGAIDLVGPEGQPLSARVAAFDDVSVTLDFNHPLAGRALVFEAEVIAVL